MDNLRLRDFLHRSMAASEGEVGRLPVATAHESTCGLQKHSGRTKMSAIATNRRYGHKDDCIFGKKNSGMCDCGKWADRPAASQGAHGPSIEELGVGDVAWGIAKKALDEKWSDAKL